MSNEIHLILMLMYGQEIKYTRLGNWKRKLVFTIFGDTHPGHLTRFFVNRKYLRKYTNKKYLRILEVGSSNGAFTFWLSRNHNYRVVGLEYDKTLVTDCHQIRNKIKRSHLFFVCADASTEFPFKINFDVVFSSHVLEHIKKDQDVLINAFKVLKPGGLLLLQIPYGDPLRSPSIKEDIENGHVREGYTEQDIRQKLEYAGFDIVIVTGSIGLTGRFACRFGKLLSKTKIIAGFSILFFPITFVLILLEQFTAFLRNREPFFSNGPFVLARRPYI